MKAYFTLMVVGLWAVICFAQAPDTVWTRTYGGTQEDQVGADLLLTIGGGYLFAGYTFSFGAGGEDFYVVETNGNGDTLRTRTYGGSSDDEARSVVLTDDSGYAIAGTTSSYGAGSRDFYVVRTNANWDTVWTRTYGGAGFDAAQAIAPAMDGGFVIAGITLSFGAGNRDVYLVRINGVGDTIRTRAYGGSNYDEASYVHPTSDSGFVIAANTYSFGPGGQNVWILKINPNLDTLWTRTYGGSGEDYAISVQQTMDGGYVFVGATNSFGAGAYDVYVVKTASNGDILWTRTYGGTGNEAGFSIQQTFDGGYIVAGNTDSFGAGGQDFFVIRTDGLGNTLWTQAYGGSNNDFAGPITQTADSGYVVVGTTSSFGAGGKDIYAIKIEPDHLLCGALAGILGIAGSPYIVTCDINVVSGDTLSIEPGVELRFAGPYKFTVEGTLLAEGTEDDSIVFTTDTLANPGRWRGIRFEDQGSSGSRLSYCMIESGAGMNNSGGGVTCSYSSPHFSHCTIRNSQAHGGGGISCNFSSPVLSNCVLSGNSSFVGGGLFSWAASPVLLNCVLSANWADEDGGGVWSDASNTTLTNCTISDNRVANIGGGVHCRLGGVTLTNCTFAGNSGVNPVESAAVFIDRSILVISNSIIASSYGAGIRLDGCSGCQITYCDVFGNTGDSFIGDLMPGLGQIITMNRNGAPCDQYYNIFLDPQFANAPAGDFHLTASSPCIDAGDPTLYDPDCTVSDMGAFFFFHLAQPESLVVMENYPHVDLCWSVVDSTDCAAPSPIRSYVIYYEAEFNEDWNFLAVATDTCYRHEHVLQFAPNSHYYQVIATDYDPILLRGIIAGLGDSPARIDVERELRLLRNPKSKS
jgi:hypothetical protein